MTPEPSPLTDSFKLPTDFFNKLPPRNVGDDDVKVIYLAVGEALDRWEMLMEEFSQLFHTYCDLSHAAVRALGTITGGRAAAINAAAEVYFAARGSSQLDTEVWNHLFEMLNTANGFRNKIAHGTVMRFNKEERTHGNFLVPPDYNSRQTLTFPDYEGDDDPLSWTGTRYRYTSQDIQAIHRKFDVLREKVNAFHAHLRKKYPNSLIPRYF